MANITIRIPDEVHQALKISSKRTRRSLNSEIAYAIEYYLKNAPEVHYDPNPPVPKETPKAKKTKP